jgi:hypothetical protein
MKLTRRRRHRWTGPNVAEGLRAFCRGDRAGAARKASKNLVAPQDEIESFIKRIIAFT